MICGWIFFGPPAVVSAYGQVADNPGERVVVELGSPRVSSTIVYRLRYPVLESAGLFNQRTGMEVENHAERYARLFSIAPIGVTFAAAPVTSLDSEVRCHAFRPITSHKTRSDSCCARRRGIRVQTCDGRTTLGRRIVIRKRSFAKGLYCRAGRGRPKVRSGS